MSAIPRNNLSCAQHNEDGIGDRFRLFPQTPSQLADWTDQYFSRTRQVVERFGDKLVTYCVFMRRPVLFAPALMLDWLDGIKAAQQDLACTVEPCFVEGDWVGAGEPMLYLTGNLARMAELETLYLQRLGAACVAAWNAYQMCTEMPNTSFIAMDARHCAGLDMAEMMAYAASVGSQVAKKHVGARGFIGNATRASAHYFGRADGMGTMPHALIGYAGSTLRAAEMYHETFPNENITVLVDYFGQEVTDAIAVCRHFPQLERDGRLAFRLDTHGGRFVEGMDTARSYQLLERYAPSSIRGYRTDSQLAHLIGTGVSAAAVWYFRESLNEAGFDRARIVVSSGFTVAKCRMMNEAMAPVDVIGTGSYLPDSWTETYVTADIVAYDGEARVKVGREFLLRRGDKIGGSDRSPS